MVGGPSGGVSKGSSILHVVVSTCFEFERSARVKII